MKVLNYITLSKEYNDDTTSIENQSYFEVCEHLAHKQSISNILDFYLQPFKPELIVELFEGWEELKTQFNYRNFQSANGTVYLHEATIMLMDYVGTSIYRIFGALPRTLDDFICDCQRSGIQLEWRIK